MVRKVKVVELNQPTTEVDTPPVAPEPVSVIDEPSVSDLEIPVEEKPAKKPRQPRQPKEPKPPKEPKIETPVIPEDEPASDGDSINTEEIMTVISEHRKKKQAPAEEPETQPKEEAKATCPDCNKIMSAKSLKYSHSKNCKSKPPPPPPPEPKKRVSKPRQPKVAPEVAQEQYFRQEVAPTIQELIQAERAMRQDARKNKFKSLLSDAFHNNI